MHISFGPSRVTKDANGITVSHVEIREDGWHAGTIRKSDKYGMKFPWELLFDTATTAEWLWGADRWHYRTLRDAKEGVRDAYQARE